jgi:hypothetical protein
MSEKKPENYGRTDGWGRTGGAMICLILIEAMAIVILVALLVSK